MPPLLRTVNVPPVSAASPSPRERALPGSSSSPRAEPSSQSRALWPSCRILPAASRAEKYERRNFLTLLYRFIRWLISRLLLWAYPPVCRLTLLLASSSPSETGCSSTPDPASLLTPVPPLSAPVAPAERWEREKLYKKIHRTGQSCYKTALVSRSVNRITEFWKW